MDDFEDLSRKVQRLEDRIDELEDSVSGRNGMDELTRRVDELEDKVTGSRGVERELEKLKKEIERASKR